MERAPSPSAPVRSLLLASTRSPGPHWSSSRADRAVRRRAPAPTPGSAGSARSWSITGSSSSTSAAPVPPARWTGPMPPAPPQTPLGCSLTCAPTRSWRTARTCAVPWAWSAGACWGSPSEGFCVTRYLSEHAQSLESVYITGGLPAVGHSIDEVYALSYEAMRAKSEEYYARFPQDRDRMASLAAKAGRGELRTAGGDLVGPERLRSLGACWEGPGERTRSTTSWSAPPTPGPSATTWGSACPSAAGSRSTPSSTSPAGPIPAPPTGPPSGCALRSSMTTPPC